MRKSATPPAPSQQQLEALATLLAASRQEKAAARSERCMTAFYLAFGVVVFLIGWWLG